MCDHGLRGTARLPGGAIQGRKPESNEHLEDPIRRGAFDSEHWFLLVANPPQPLYVLTASHIDRQLHAFWACIRHQTRLLPEKVVVRRCLRSTGDCARSFKEHCQATAHADQRHRAGD